MDKTKKILSLFMAVLIPGFTAVHGENDIQVILDGKPIEFDVPPQIIDDRTLVPVRAIFEALGAEVEWDENTDTVTADKINSNMIKSISMTVGEKQVFTYSGAADDNVPVPEAEMFEIDVPLQIIDGRALVPVRVVSEFFDCDVSWDGESRTVNIDSADDTANETFTDAVIPIEYDDTEERKAHYMRDFKITDFEINSDGQYNITYTLRTFLEGKGDVIVTFECLDENGSRVDTFTSTFRGVDYTWTPQEAAAVISGKTKVIRLILE